jgi:hypothetical protein
MIESAWTVQQGVKGRGGVNFFKHIVNTIMRENYIRKKFKESIDFL